MKNISIWGNKLEKSNNFLRMCDYFDEILCGEIATWEHQNNRSYCDNHHLLANKINREKQKEFINEYKEKIIKCLKNEKRRLDEIKFTRNQLIKKGYHKEKETIAKYIDLGREVFCEYFLNKIEGDYFDD